MVGGRIGKDGIHGATFSSEALSETSPTSAVQIGDPITQKKMLDMLLEARDLGLYRGLTDNGAGGLSSSLGEMATLSGGVRIDLDACPLKYQGLAPWEILVSESQERMSLAVPPEKLDALPRPGAAARRGGDGRRRVHRGRVRRGASGGQARRALDLAFLHDGLPTMELRAEWIEPRQREALGGRALRRCRGSAAPRHGACCGRCSPTPTSARARSGCGSTTTRCRADPWSSRSSGCGATRPPTARCCALRPDSRARHHRDARHLPAVRRLGRVRHGPVRGGRGGARPRGPGRRPRPDGRAGQLLLARSGGGPGQPRRRLQARPARAGLPRPCRRLPRLRPAAHLGQGLDEERRPGRRQEDLHPAHAPRVPDGHRARRAPLADHGLQATRAT